ncbi:MAG TPA: FMN-binding negative transcriptional regulator [Gemmataceae bacterium]|nr:FMN-binding negative transcriptional regulator [Gemmataceae bacterium]
MYIPTAFRAADRAALYELIEQYAFGTLVTVLDGAPFATHLPFLIDHERGVLLGHVARANPHGRALDGPAEALVIFQGPHAYVSPSWYATAPAVPTWNYAAVHVYGVPRLLDEGRLLELLKRLVSKYESGRERPWTMDLPADYRRTMVQAIIGFALPITRVEGKFKLSQNRPAADRRGVIRALRAGDAGEQELAEFMTRFAPPAD